MTKNSDGLKDYAIHRAAGKGDIQKLRRLVEKDANAINKSDSVGARPLVYAIRSSSLECVQCLMDNGADLSLIENAGLSEATTPELAQWLISHGADVNKAVDDRVPLESACRGLCEGVVRVLLEHGATTNLNQQSKLKHTLIQSTLSNYATYSKPESCARIISLLIEHGADVNAKNWLSRTALHDACQNGLVELVPVLLSYDANPNIADVNKRTAFDEAANFPEILELLEPRRGEVIAAPELPNNFDQIIERLLRIGSISREDLHPCSEEDIVDLERRYKLILPNSYKTFLRLMGRGAGSFLEDDHWYAFLDDLAGSCMGGNAEVMIAGVKLPRNHFVFASRLGTAYFYFVADGVNENPQISAYNQSGNLGVVNISLWDFFEERVRYYEFYAEQEL